MSTKRVLLIFSFCLVLFLLIFNFGQCSKEESSDYNGTDLVVEDFPYQWKFDKTKDLQFPELPTGCEATAASIISRMQGVLVTKTEIANALPKAKTSYDFVDAYIGNPYSYTGWSCSARAITKTLNVIFSTREEFAAVELTGDDLDSLKLPAAVWVSINMAIPKTPSYTSEGYMIFYNTHCVAVTKVTDDEVYTVDPLRGEFKYDRDIFEAVYNRMGKEAVYVGNLDEVSRLIRERNQL